MNRTDVINFYLNKVRSPKYYLEIGINNPANNFDKVKADVKDGVDLPNNKYQYTHNMTSDGFFLINKEKYDVIFIDGLHTFEQSYKDFINAEKCLNENGVIIMHDCNPIKESDQFEERTSRTWNGTAWKTFVKLRQERDDLEMFCVDCDWGVGVIKKGSQKLLDKDIPDYNAFNKYRVEALNLISPKDFR